MSILKILGSWILKETSHPGCMLFAISLSRSWTARFFFKFFILIPSSHGGLDLTEVRVLPEQYEKAGEGEGVECVQGVVTKDLRIEIKGEMRAWVRLRDSKIVVKSDYRSQRCQRIFEVGVPEGACADKRDAIGKWGEWNWDYEGIVTGDNRVWGVSGSEWLSQGCGEGYVKLSSCVKIIGCCIDDWVLFTALLRHRASDGKQLLTVAFFIKNVMQVTSQYHKFNVISVPSSWIWNVICLN